ncbi:IclR family transcriptional regulator [Neobacillus mesonae]|uniref:IclR family transcriptional regulator n=1 Tax=Neobacillus mesonae TaxID=1193713 RepID=UPI002E1DBD9C|nr:IclR family transcriptional regulator [Neobacillus mesonae]
MNQSVIKALGLLDLFSKEQKELTLSEIAEKSGMTKPTVFRLLTSLEVCGFLTKIKNNNQDVRYRLGLKLLELGNLVAEALELRAVALPLMKKLCADIDEVVHLAILDQDKAVYIEKVETNQAVRLYTRIGKRSELYVGSGPKLLLSYLPRAERLELIKNMTFKKLTEHTIDNASVLEEEIRQIREQGYAVSYGEQDDGTIGISYPIYDYKNEVVAALNVSGPETRIKEKLVGSVKEKTRDTALRISEELGYSRV